MRQRLFILAALVVLVILMIGLNAATYVQKEKVPDTEFAPNRSTYNSGSTGSQAYFTLLSETGRKVTRWQSPIDKLLTEKKNKPNVFVMIGPFRKEFQDTEVNDLLRWVAEGGRLVMIDREPPKPLLATTSSWQVSISPKLDFVLTNVDPSDKTQMTDGTPAAKPVQPSVFTAGVNAVQPSRFASTIRYERNNYLDEPDPDYEEESAAEEDYYERDSNSNTQPHDFFQDAPPPPKAVPSPQVSPAPDSKSEVKEDPVIVKRSNTGPAVEKAWFKGPVTHIAGADRQLVADVPYGAGQIVYLSDPYVVSNAGINLVDNGILGINLVSSNNGLIAFNEFHHGYGSNRNRIFEYFDGTPVMAIFFQLCAIAALILLSQSRRFARPVAEPEADRLSKLEYVAAMAELQQRTKAFDLAMENVYTDFRRRAAKHFGVDNTITGRPKIAELIAERIKTDAAEIEELMRTCEDIIHGEPTNKKETLKLVARIREIEDALRLTRRGRSML
ncbi:MAG: DUF4350 domain-containing protein [Blastocatellia bacterium]